MHKLCMQKAMYCTSKSMALQPSCPQPKIINCVTLVIQTVAVIY